MLYFPFSETIPATPLTHAETAQNGLQRVFYLYPTLPPDFRPLAACRPARAVAMGIPAPLPLAAWRSARTPLTLFRAEGSTVGPHGPSCQLGGEAGRLAGVVLAPACGGTLSTVAAKPRARTRASFVKPFVKTFVGDFVTGRKASAGAGFSRFWKIERWQFSERKVAVFRAKVAVFRAESTR